MPRTAKPFAYQPALLFSLVALAISISPAWAQLQFGSQKKDTKPSLWGAPKTPAMSSARMSKPVELPDIPEFSGKHQFLGGDFSVMKTGNSYNMSFSANETKQQILQWYGDALRNNKWQNIFQSDHNVGGKKNGNSCNIMVSDAHFAHARSLISISYYAENNR